MKRKLLCSIVVLALSATVQTVAAQAAPAKAAAVKIIGAPVVEGTTNTTAVIAWTTNTGGSTVVKYGTDKNNLPMMAQAPYSTNKNHRVQIKNLKPGTTYYFQVGSAQGEGTGTEDRSAIGQFTTKGGAPAASAGGGDADDKGKPEAERIIGSPVVEGTTKTTAVIAWTTNTCGSTVVKYGTDQNNLSQTAQAPYSDNDSTKAQNHRVHIQNLKPGTKYYFQVVSGQGEGTGTEAKSPVGEFSTK